MGRYSTAYRAIIVLRALAGSEALATAVAFVPSVSDLLPRDADVVRKLGRNVGSSLASAEHTDLERALASRLAGLAEKRQAMILRDLWEEVTKE